MQKKPHAKVAKAAKIQQPRRSAARSFAQCLVDCFSVQFSPEPLRPSRTLRKAAWFRLHSYGLAEQADSPLEAACQIYVSLFQTAGDGNRRTLSHRGIALPQID